MQQSDTTRMAHNYAPVFHCVYMNSHSPHLRPLVHALRTLCCAPMSSAGWKGLLKLVAEYERNTTAVSNVRLLNDDTWRVVATKDIAPGQRPCLLEDGGSG